MLLCYKIFHALIVGSLPVLLYIGIFSWLLIGQTSPSYWYLRNSSPPRPKRRSFWVDLGLEQPGNTSRVCSTVLYENSFCLHTPMKFLMLTPQNTHYISVYSGQPLNWIQLEFCSTTKHGIGSKEKQLNWVNLVPPNPSVPTLVLQMPTSRRQKTASLEPCCTHTFLRTALKLGVAQGNYNMGKTNSRTSAFLYSMSMNRE